MAKFKVGDVFVTINGDSGKYEVTKLDDIYYYYTYTNSEMKSSHHHRIKSVDALCILDDLSCLKKEFNKDLEDLLEKT